MLTEGLTEIAPPPRRWSYTRPPFATPLAFAILLDSARAARLIAVASAVGQGCLRPRRRVVAHAGALGDARACPDGVHLRELLPETQICPSIDMGCANSVGRQLVLDGNPRNRALRYQGAVYRPQSKAGASGCCSRRVDYLSSFCTDIPESSCR